MPTKKERFEMIDVLTTELPVLRAKAKLSQEEVAERIGISRQTLSSIETRNRKMTWTTFLALIALFQNNENTKQLLYKIDGLLDGLEQEFNANSDSYNKIKEIEK